MVDQPTHGVPVYVVNSIAGDRPRVLHRFLLLPLQGRIRQEGGTGEERSPDSESESETHEADRATCGRPRGTSQLHVNSTKKRGAPVHLSQDSQPTLTSLSSPEHMTGDEDSSEDEEYTTPSALTARGSTPVDSPPSTAVAVEDDRQSAAPELVSDMPIMAQPLPPDQTLNRVNIEHEQEHESDEDSESDSDSNPKRHVPTAPRRSARSTKGIPPVCYGQVQIHSTIISELAKPTRYRQILYAPCYQQAETNKS